MIQSILQTGNFLVEVSVEANNGIDRVEFYLDDKKEFFTTTAPYNGYLNVSKFLEEGSSHLIIAKVIDSFGYSAQSAIEIKIANDNEIKIDEDKDKDK